MKIICNLKAYIGVLFLQCLYARMDIVYKAALNYGMSIFVLNAYEHILATLVIAPFAMIIDRKRRVPMTFSIFAKLVVLALLEPIFGMNMFVLGMKYTTATVAATMINALLAMTFILACLVRLEKLNFKSKQTYAKIVETIVIVGGAMIMTFIKGPGFELMQTKAKSNREQQIGNGGTDSHHHSIMGGGMILSACFSWACFSILQTFTLNAYPKLSLTAWICFFGAIGNIIVALVIEKDKAAWAIHWDVKLLAVLYGGIGSTGLASYIQACILKDRGPVFVTAFAPISMIMVAVLSSWLLAEKMYMGRIVGAVIIIVGIYVLIWGKSKEESTNENSGAD
ncbi:hypothetical protein ACB092_10G041200 [Castanea dentata]